MRSILEHFFRRHKVHGHCRMSSRASSCVILSVLLSHPERSEGSLYRSKKPRPGFFASPRMTNLALRPQRKRACTHDGELFIRAQSKRPGGIRAFRQLSSGDDQPSLTCLIWATVQLASPTLKRAKRRTIRFSPSLPTFWAINCPIVTLCSLIKGCSSRQTSS